MQFQFLSEIFKHICVYTLSTLFGPQFQYFLASNYTSFWPQICYPFKTLNPPFSNIQIVPKSGQITLKSSCNLSCLSDMSTNSFLRSFSVWVIPLMCLSTRSECITSSAGKREVVTNTRSDTRSISSNRSRPRI